MVYPEADISLILRIRQRLLALTMPILAVIVYFLMRYHALAKDTGISTAVTGVVGGYDFVDKIRVSLKVYGFYFKKTFMPWPLNFGIVEVSNWYVLPGIILVIVLVLLVRRADLLVH